MGDCVWEWATSFIKSAPRHTTLYTPLECGSGWLAEPPIQQAIPAIHRLLTGHYCQAGDVQHECISQSVFQGADDEPLLDKQDADGSEPTKVRQYTT